MTNCNFTFSLSSGVQENYSFANSVIFKFTQCNSNLLLTLLNTTQYIYIYIYVCVCVCVCVCVLRKMEIDSMLCKCKNMRKQNIQRMYFYDNNTFQFFHKPSAGRLIRHISDEAF